MSNDEFENPYHAPMAERVHQKSQLPPDLQGDATGGLIPYKNPHALFAYYTAIASLFPCVGALLGIVAFVLGIIGLKKRKNNPAIKGSVHAWIGIILGGLMAVVWTVLILLVVVGGLLA